MVSLGVYRLIQLKTFAIRALLTLVNGGVIAGFYHIGYFILNLSEWLSISTEQKFIYGYIFIALGIIATVVIDFVKIQKTFNPFLENHFNLNFRWYNAVNEYHTGKQVPETEVKDIFQGLTTKVIFSTLLAKKSFITLLGLLGWSLLLLPILLTPRLQSQFNDNLLTIWNFKEPYLEIHYPNEILAGGNFTLRYHGGYSEAKFIALGNEQLLQNSEEFTLSNINSSFNVDYTLTKGRIKKNGSIFIKVWQPPQLTESSVSVFDTISRSSYSLSGIFSTVVNPGSRVRLVLFYQEDQRITNTHISVFSVAGEQTQKINLTPQLVLGYQNLPNAVMAEVQLRNDLKITFESINQHGQLSPADNFTLTLKQNKPPSVAITEPENLLTLDKAKSQNIIFIAKDDLALSKVSLHYEITTKQTQKQKRFNNVETLTLPRPPSGSLSPNNENTDKELGYYSLLISNVILPLNELTAPPDSRIRYYLRATDNEGMSGFSATNQIRINTLEKTYSTIIEASDRVSQNLGDRKSDFDNLQRDYEKLKIQGETQKLNTQDLKNFQENISELSQKVQDDINKIEELEKDGTENKQVFSESFQKKLQELKNELSKIDENYLQRMNQNFETLINNLDGNIKPQDVNSFLNKLDLQQMEQRIEQTVNYLKNLQRLQKLDSLEKLSQNLYLRYKDLESYMVAELLSDDQIKQEANSIKEGLEFIKKEFDSVKKELPNTSVTESIKRKIDELLEENQLNALDQLAQNKNQDSFLKERSRNLDELRRNFAKLNSINQELDQNQVVNTLNKQIITLSGQLAWVEKLLDNEVIDLGATKDDKKFNILTEFLSKHKTLIYNFRETMFLLSSAATLEIDFMEMYDKVIENFTTIEKRISPSQQSPEQNRKIQFKENFQIVKDDVSILTRELILLKNIFNKIRNQEQENMNMSRAMENQRNLNQRIENLLQQGNLSEREMQYLRDLALEQNFLRSMMEQLPEQQGQQGQDGEQGQEQGNKSGEGQPNNNQSGEGPGQQTGGNEATSKSTTSGTTTQDKQSGSGGAMSEIDENIQKTRNNRKDTVGKPGGISDKRRREIVDKMKELERELIKQNPDLAKISELQKSIDDNLFEANTGFQKEQEQKSEERVAEREQSIYENAANNVQLRNSISKKSTDELEKLKRLQDSLKRGDYKRRIERFIELNGS